MENAADTITEDQRAITLAYLKGEMSEPERDDFENALAESEILRDELSRSRALLDALESAADPTIVRLVNAVIVNALDHGASDLHLVPRRKRIEVLIRVDGSLRELMMLPTSTLAGVVDRWKVMADMNLGENQLPQDGRFPFPYQNREYDFRVNVLPTLYGERITARILSRSAVPLGLDRIGLSPAAQATLARLASLESGLVLTSGHTGVGKTTLLYSLLLEIQKSGLHGRSLMTVEDPVEMHLNGISQTPINNRAGMTFAAALKSMRRCDADVVLCGELRNLESAELCVELALTGHLVLSALHTTSALGTIERLRNIGVEGFLIADTLVVAIGQRLVRRIDPGNMEEYQPADEELRQAGLTRADGPFLRGTSTEANGGTGYKGRIPLVEVAEITPALRRLIADRAPLEELWRTAFHAGGSLREEGRSRVKAGLTTVEEVNRVLSNYPV